MQIKRRQLVQVPENLSDADAVLDNEVVDLLVLDEDLGFGIAKDLVVAEEVDFALESGYDGGVFVGVEGNFFVLNNRHCHHLVEVCAKVVNEEERNRFMQLVHVRSSFFPTGIACFYAPTSV